MAKTRRLVRLRTTVVGSYPKPEYLKIPDWFAPSEGKKGLLGTSLSAYSDFAASKTEEESQRLEEDVMRATEEVLKEQCTCGVDVPTDGEVRRENYIHFLCRFIDGIDFSGLTETSVRNGAFTASIPTIRGKVAWKGGLSCAEEWRKSQDASPGKPVKYTLPGPMTIIGSTANVYYEDEATLAADLATIVNLHVRELSEAGCKHIQVDEPLFARKPDEALKYGVRLLDVCFEGCAPDVEKTVHVCCGYPGRVDQKDYLKADRNAYYRLAPALDDSCIDCVSLEDAWCHNDLRLLRLFKKTKVVLGVVNSSSSRVETVEQIRRRITCALRHIPAERLQVAPDCGLALLQGAYKPKLIQKLKNMCIAAKMVAVPPVGPMAAPAPELGGARGTAALKGPRKRPAAAVKSRPGVLKRPSSATFARAGGPRVAKRPAGAGRRMD